MATPPCVDSTCSIDSDVDGDGHLELSVHTHPTGGIQCVGGLVDPHGLAIELNPDPGNNALVDAAGLFVGSPAHEIVTGLGGTEVGFPADNTQTANSANLNVVNNSASRQRLAIIHAKFVFQYSVVAAAWSTDGSFVLDIDGSLVAQSFALGGADSTPGADSTDNKQHDAHITVYRTLPPGGAINVKTYGSGRSQQTTGTFVNTPAKLRGFIDVLVLDMPAADLFSIT